MSSLASFIPRIQDLVRDDITTNEDHRDCEAAAESDEKFSSWRLVFLLSSLLGALVSLGKQEIESIFAVLLFQLLCSDL